MLVISCCRKIDPTNSTCAIYLCVRREKRKIFSQICNRVSIRRMLMFVWWNKFQQTSTLSVASFNLEPNYWALSSSCFIKFLLFMFFFFFFFSSLVSLVFVFHLLSLLCALVVLYSWPQPINIKLCTRPTCILVLPLVSTCWRQVHQAANHLIKQTEFGQ